MIILRVYKGIADHFPMRFTEWVMMMPTFGMAAALHASPDMFAVSSSFGSLARWADEGTWGLIVLFCGVVRLAALTVNGTFKGFRFSPHLRFGASLVGIFFWSQWTLGFALSWASLGGAPSGIVAYGTFCAMELANLTRSGSDIGKDIRGV
ncbi:hypothetical protein E3C22_18280 [Jiella endophytica]|uniref:Uncharacterized protein n=1 Tax=Jiella endophytica TaxID=2558362 RepID=A0A4Y8RET9_9HYPH|nr:hypothetical protein [Jiella endophytica]TFF20836.1 hypothetical protein E3C22_18280 [Jiella endophytica]